MSNPTAAASSPVASDDVLEDLPVAVWARYESGPIRRYKGRGTGPAKKPRCVACFPRSTGGEVVPIGHGVALVLCAEHRDVRFIASRGGRDFLAAVASVFESVGLTDAKYLRALTRFVNQVRDRLVPTPRRRPGSYAWPELRHAAERVWEAGGAYADGERAVFAGFIELRFPGHVRPPSIQTVRRWWSQRRWISRRPGEEPVVPRRERIVLVDRRATRVPVPPSEPDDAPDPARHWLRVRRRREGSAEPGDRRRR